jgi:hypothetical protein
VRSWVDALLAIPFAALPKRYWQSFDLPVQNVAPLSSFMTMIAGFVIGIPGYFAYLARLQGVAGLSILEISKLQVQGKLPETEAVSAVPAGVYALSTISFAFASPLGLFCTYLVISGLIRVASAYTGEALGDPILTALDWLGRRMFTTRQQQAVRVARERLEKIDEPDRRYDGEWAGLTGVDFVIVAARRKPEWTRGTWIITDDGWFVLGEPFDRPMPNGLRTIYPLSEQKTLEPLRKSVQYRLPPLRKDKR